MTSQDDKIAELYDKMLLEKETLEKGENHTVYKQHHQRENSFIHEASSDAEENMYFSNEEESAAAEIEEEESKFAYELQPITTQEKFNPNKVINDVSRRNSLNDFNVVDNDENNFNNTQKENILNQQQQRINKEKKKKSLNNININDDDNSKQFQTSREEIEKETKKFKEYLSNKVTELRKEKEQNIVEGVRQQQHGKSIIDTKNSTGELPCISSANVHRKSTNFKTTNNISNSSNIRNNVINNKEIKEKEKEKEKEKYKQPLPPPQPPTTQPRKSKEIITPLERLRNSRSNLERPNKEEKKYYTSSTHNEITKFSNILPHVSNASKLPTIPSIPSIPLINKEKNTKTKSLNKIEAKESLTNKNNIFRIKKAEVANKLMTGIEESAAEVVEENDYKNNFKGVEKKSQRKVPTPIPAQTIFKQSPNESPEKASLNNKKSREEFKKLNEQEKILQDAILKYHNKTKHSLEEVEHKYSLNISQSSSLASEKYAINHHQQVSPQKEQKLKESIISTKAKKNHQQQEESSSLLANEKSAKETNKTNKDRKKSIEIIETTTHFETQSNTNSPLKQAEKQTNEIMSDIEKINELIKQKQDNILNCRNILERNAYITFLERQEQQQQGILEEEEDEEEYEEEDEVRDLVVGMKEENNSSGLAQQNNKKMSTTATGSYGEVMSEMKKKKWRLQQRINFETHRESGSSKDLPLSTAKASFTGSETKKVTNTERENNMLLLNDIIENGENRIQVNSTRLKDLLLN